jgi:hypothetical protein
LPNLHSKRFWLENEKRFVRLTVSAQGMQLIDKHGIDRVLPDLRARGEKVWRMGIPNVKRYRILNEETNEMATVMAVLPRNADIPAYLADASKRFDWNGWRNMQAASFKVRVGQQKQAKKE